MPPQWRAPRVHDAKLTRQQNASKPFRANRRPRASGWDEQVEESEVDLPSQPFCRMEGSTVDAPESHRIGEGTQFNRTLASRARGQVAGLTRDDATNDDVDRSLYSIKFFVHHWKARRRQFKQSVKEEVQKRRKLHGADLSDSDFVPQPVMLRDLHVHTESAVDRALSHMAQNRRHGMLQSQAGMVQRLLYVLEALGRLGAVHVESQLCIEVSAMLCDVLMGSSCDFYPVASANDGGRFETFVHVGCKRVPINVKYTAFLGRIAARSARGGDRTATIISDPAAEIRDGANHVAGVAMGGDGAKVAKGAALPLHTTTFYDTGVGMRELLVRRAQDTGLVAATLRERGYATAAGGSLESTEVAQARLAPPRSPAQSGGAHRCQPALTSADVRVLRRCSCFPSSSRGGGCRSQKMLLTTTTATAAMTMTMTTTAW